MFRKLTMLLILITFCSTAVGAQEIAAAMKAQSVQAQPAEQRSLTEPDLSAFAAKQEKTLVALNDTQRTPAVDEARKTHTGLTWSEFVDVHFGGYRWIYWAGAAVALVALHVAVAD